MTALALLIVGAAAFGALGAWRGRIGPVNLAVAAGTAVFAGCAWTLYRLKTYRALGLLGPLALALLVGAAVSAVLWLYWRRREPSRPQPTGPRRAVAGVVGALEGVGLVLVVALVAVLLERSVEVPPDQPLPREGDWSARAVFADMTRLLNRGLLSHLPLADRYGQALEDLATILNAPPECLARAGERLGLLELAQLDAVQAVLEDVAVAEAVEDLRRGHIGALYRLQANPHLQALIEDPTFRAAVKRFTLAEIARAVRAESEAGQPNSKPLHDGASTPAAESQIPARPD